MSTAAIVRQTDGCPCAWATCTAAANRTCAACAGSMPVPDRRFAARPLPRAPPWCTWTSCSRMAGAHTWNSPPVERVAALHLGRRLPHASATARAPSEPGSGRSPIASRRPLPYRSPPLGPGLLNNGLQGRLRGLQSMFSLGRSELHNSRPSAVSGWVYTWLGAYYSLGSYNLLSVKL
jgi:hypothetical protein